MGVVSAYFQFLVSVAEKRKRVAFLRGDIMLSRGGGECTFGRFLISACYPILQLGLEGVLPALEPQLKQVV